MAELSYRNTVNSVNHEIGLQQPRFGQRFLTEEEYVKQADDFTKRELKKSGLYYKHKLHFWRLQYGSKFDSAWVLGLKITIAFVVLVVPILLGMGLFGEAPFGFQTEVSMLPNPGKSMVRIADVIMKNL